MTRKKRKVRERVEERLERMGFSVAGGTATGVEYEFDAHEIEDWIDAMFLILGILGALSLGLSAFLIINTMNAILVQQVWQIGVMKVIGATFGRVVRLYLVIASVYGGLAVLLAVPLSYPGARLFSDAIGRALFGMALDFSYSLTGVIIWLAIVLTLSALAGLWPALRATKVSMRESLAYE